MHRVAGSDHARGLVDGDPGVQGRAIGRVAAARRDVKLAPRPGRQQQYEQDVHPSTPRFRCISGYCLEELPGEDPIVVVGQDILPAPLAYKSLAKISWLIFYPIPLISRGKRDQNGQLIPSAGVTEPFPFPGGCDTPMTFPARVFIEIVSERKATHHGLVSVRQDKPG